MRLTHLQRLTDDTGIIQHAVYDVPNDDHGYCTDDNARALIVSVMLAEADPEHAELAERLARRYLAFIGHAFDATSGHFHNMMSYERHWLDEVGSEDSNARALWALGVVIGRSPHAGLRAAATRVFDAALPLALGLTHVRSWGYAMLGVHEYLQRLRGHRRAEEVRRVLAERLLDASATYSADDWPWFGEAVTYANAVVPHALALAGWQMGREEMLETALRSLRWLAEIQTSEDVRFEPIGTEGFFHRDRARADFDQQAIEAASMVLAALSAFAITDDAFWREAAHTAFGWFIGANRLAVPLADVETGGCRDGLHPDRANENQGAESTLAYLLALLAMRCAEEGDCRAERPIVGLVSLEGRSGNGV